MLHSINQDERTILVEAAKDNLQSVGGNAKKCGKTFSRPPFFSQLKFLMIRDSRDIIRNWKSFFLTRMLVSIIVSTVAGVVYFQIGQETTITSSQNQIYAYRGCVVVLCCISMFANAQATILAIPLQRKIFQREYSLNMYSSMTYLLGKIPMEYLLSVLQTVVQLIISFFLCGLNGNFGIYLVVLVAVTVCADSIALSLSCLTESPISAIQMLPIAIIPQIIFSGLIVSIQSIPGWIRWMQYICFMPYAVKLLTMTEFGCENVEVLTDGDVTCARIAFDGIMLVVLAAGFRLVGLVALQFKRKSHR